MSPIEEAAALPPLPSRLLELTEALTRNHWTFKVQHQSANDDGNPGPPFVTVEALRKGSPRLIVAWHTRATGTYRLFSCLIGHCDGTYKKALEHARSAS